jgi:hypothetical protein
VLNSVINVNFLMKTLAHCVPEAGPVWAIERNRLKEPLLKIPGG